MGDPSVPLMDSYECYHALSDGGVEVESCAYPADVQPPHDIVRMPDVDRRWAGRMVKHLQ